LKDIFPLPHIQQLCPSHQRIILWQELCTTPDFTLITVKPIVHYTLVKPCYTNSLLVLQQKRVMLLNNRYRPFYEIRLTGKISEWYVTLWFISLFSFPINKLKICWKIPFLLSQVTLEHLITMSQH